MATLADKAILSGADNHPPMLEKYMYDSWKSRMEPYMMNRLHGRMILKSVENGPLIWPSIKENEVTRSKKYSKLSATEAIQADCDINATNIILQELPPKVYALVSNHKIAKELWEIIQLLMQGTSLTKQERECKLYDEFDTFAYKKGETLHDFYLRFSLLLNDINIYNMKLEQFQVNTKFVNTLPPEWSKFVTDIKPDPLALVATHQMTQKRDDSWFKKKVLLVQAQANGQVLHEDELAFLADLKVAEAQATQTVITHNVGYQADYLDAYDSDCDELNTAKVALMANLSHYGLDALSKVHNHDNVNNDMINQVVQAMPSSEQSNVVTHSETEITKEQVVILKEGQHVDLRSNDTVSDSSTQSVEIDRLKQTLLEHLKEKESLMQTVTLLKNDFKKEESRNIDKEIALEKRIKQLDNIIFKRDQFAQTVRMHTQEEAAVLRDLVDHIKANYPPDHTLDSAYSGCDLNEQGKKVRFTKPVTSSRNTITKIASTSNIVSNKPTLSSTGIKPSTSASGSQPSGNTKKDKIRQTPSSTQKNKVEAYHRRVKSSLKNKDYVVKPNGTAHVQHSKLNANYELKCVKCNGFMLSDNHVLDFINNMNAHAQSKSIKKSSKRKVWKQTRKVFTNIEYIWRHTDRTFTIVGNACPLTRITTTTKVPLRKPTTLDNETSKPVVTLVYSRKPTKSKTNVPVSKSKYLDSGYFKHMTGDLSQLTNFVNKFLVTVKFRNDHMAKILGYGDYQIKNVTISKVYYVDGLGHNLFFVGQFCDSNLEVAFLQHTRFIRNLECVDLLTGPRGNNLYTLSLGDFMASSPIFLLSKASKTKSWLWHPHLSHLNFGAINHLAKHSLGLVRGLPKLKFEKDHLCSACATGKSTRKTQKPKSEDTNQKKLYLLHMDLCGPMRVESVNGKKYILVIVDDYSRFTWVRLKVPVRRIRTDNGTEFVNQTLREYYEEVGISHETSVARSPQQNGVVERRNRTLIEAARTMLIYAQAPFFLWAEADLLFQPMFDELLNPPPSVVNQTPEVIAPIAEVIPPGYVDSIGSPSSTMVEQDAPSTSNSPKLTDTQSSVIPQDVGDDNLDMEVAHIGNVTPLFVKKTLCHNLGVSSKHS
uniref:Retrovirus-related Pol polyprotein from transposon TNT 1-94 n=1 Tax=Tanacetum cinerariifolium TaxID=118510 RepID=A0A6L2JY67_TANCI|nr:retrovirus-related Pol polyprotein from transposon TNT 1-94 [Tanacetum cinerariifolium]